MAVIEIDGLPMTGPLSLLTKSSEDFARWCRTNDQPAVTVGKANVIADTAAQMHRALTWVYGEVVNSGDLTAGSPAWPIVWEAIERGERAVSALEQYRTVIDSTLQRLQRRALECDDEYSAALTEGVREGAPFVEVAVRRCDDGTLHAASTPGPGVDPVVADHIEYLVGVFSQMQSTADAYFECYERARAALEDEDAREGAAEDAGES